jgi:hypothetical protein
MGGYPDFVGLCGFDRLREFLLGGSPGDRFVVSIDLAPELIPEQESCGTSTTTALVETPRCGVFPKDAPDSIRFYVFHHTRVNISQGSISQLFDQGFTPEQVSVILSQNGEIGAGVISVVFPYTTSIEDAILSGFTQDQIKSVLISGIEDWVYDATRSDLRDEISKLLTQAQNSDSKKSCYLNFWGTLDGDKISGEIEGKRAIVRPFVKSLQLESGKLSTFF